MGEKGDANDPLDVFMNIVRLLESRVRGESCNTPKKLKPGAPKRKLIADVPSTAKEEEEEEEDNNEAKAKATGGGNKPDVGPSKKKKKKKADQMKTQGPSKKPKTDVHGAERSSGAKSIVGTVFSPLRFTIRKLPDPKPTMADTHKMTVDGRDDALVDIESMNKIEGGPEALQSAALNSSVEMESATRNSPATFVVPDFDLNLQPPVEFTDLDRDETLETF